MPKSTKRFIISTSALNAQGFRMLTEGVVLDDFDKNPLMLFNHTRPEGSDKNQILPIGHWEDIEVNGDEISGVPVFDDKDEFAMQIYNKVEGNHIRMCSAGAEPLETSSKPSLLLPDQTKATVTKWRLKEVSICDIGANPNALTVALYDTNDKLIKLSDTSLETLIPNIMSKPTTTAKKAAEKAAADAKKTALAAQKLALKLADDAAKTPDSEDAELSDDEPDGDEPDKTELSDDDKDAQIEQLKAQLADAQAQLKMCQEQLKLADVQQEEAKCTQLANKAVALRKITLAQVDHVVKLARADYNGTVEYLNSISTQKSIRETIQSASGKDADNKLVQLSSKSWDELFHSKDDLSFIKLNAPDVYKTKFKEKFGREPKN